MAKSKGVTNKSLRESAASRERTTFKPPKDGYGGPHDPRKANTVEITDALWVWMHDMALWGKDVREDIKRIEKYLKLAAGDPGDPPPPPPDDNQ